MRVSPLLLISALTLSCSPLWAVPYNFDIASLSNPASGILFNGFTDSFSFPPDGSNARDFSISNSGSGDLDGLFGSITGTFTIGPITVNGSRQQAAVSGIGQFSIYDSAGLAITADLIWVDILTRTNPATTLGKLDTLGTVNLTNFSGYTGSNARLQSFAGNSGDVVLTMALDHGANLTALVADGTTLINAYSGSASVESSVAVPDSPLGLPALAALWLGLMVTAGFHHQRQVQEGKV